MIIKTKFDPEKDEVYVKLDAQLGNMCGLRIDKVIFVRAEGKIFYALSDKKEYEEIELILANEAHELALSFHEQKVKFHKEKIR